MKEIEFKIGNRFLVRITANNEVFAYFLKPIDWIYDHLPFYYDSIDNREIKSVVKSVLDYFRNHRQELKSYLY